MVITTGMIVTLMAIASPLFAGAIWFFGLVDKKLKAQDTATVARVAAVKEDHTNFKNRLELLEKNAVSKDDYQNDRDATNRAIEGIAIALRDTTATITGRIDLVLFEAGRRRREND